MSRTFRREPKAPRDEMGFVVRRALSDARRNLAQAQRDYQRCLKALEKAFESLDGGAISDARYDLGLAEREVAYWEHEVESLR